MASAPLAEDQFPSTEAFRFWLQASFPEGVLPGGFTLSGLPPIQRS